MQTFGMDAATGARLNGFAHLRQSIQDIFTTPIGSRALRRAYGSQMFLLLDQNVTSRWVMAATVYAAKALAAWEPRFRLTKLSAKRGAGAGEVTIDLDGVYVPTGSNTASPVSFSGLVL